MNRFWKTLAVVAVVGLIGQPVAAERVLRLTLQLPITNVLGQNVTAFKEIVEKESNGGIKIEIYPSAKLYKDKEVPDAVASGAIEMGVAGITRFAPLKPAVKLFKARFCHRKPTATAPLLDSTFDLDHTGSNHARHAEPTKRRQLVASHGNALPPALGSHSPILALGRFGGRTWL